MSNLYRITKIPATRRLVPTDFAERLRRGRLVGSSHWAHSIGFIESRDEPNVTEAWAWHREALAALDRAIDREQHPDPEPSESQLERAAENVGVPLWQRL